MRNIFLMGLGLVSIIGLTACTKDTVKPPAGPFLDVIPMTDVIARCGTVQWQEPALALTSANQNVWIYRNGTWSAAPASALSQKSVLVGDGMYQVVNNGTPFTSLDSTFTCTKTGEILKASYTFPTASSSAVIWLEVKNDKLTGEWKIPQPLD